MRHAARPLRSHAKAKMADRYLRSLSLLSRRAHNSARRFLLTCSKTDLSQTRDDYILCSHNHVTMQVCDVLPPHASSLQLSSKMLCDSSRLSTSYSGIVCLEAHGLNLLHVRRDACAEQAASLVAIWAAMSYRLCSRVS